MNHSGWGGHGAIGNRGSPERRGAQKKGPGKAPEPFCGCWST